MQRMSHLDAARFLQGVGNLDGARASLDMAAAESPDDPSVKLARAALGTEFLMCGRYVDGWPLIEARIGLRPDLVPPIRAPYPEWKGEDLAGNSIFVWVEQGIGDQIMLARFGRELANRGARVTLACNPSLEALFKTVPGVADVIPVPAGGNVAVPRHDYWTRYFSLPGHIGATVENLPGAPYVRAIAGIPSDHRVGFFWKSSPSGTMASVKSIPDDEARILVEEGALCLHPDATGARNFAETASIVDGLDLVVSVDTAVAHLAGAM